MFNSKDVALIDYSCCLSSLASYNLSLLASYNLSLLAAYNLHNSVVNDNTIM